MSTNSPSSNSRVMTLLGVLVLALCALAYEYKVARPALQKGYDDVNELNTKQNQSGETKATSGDDVQRALGRKPDRVEEYGVYVVETYGYASGLPFRKHNLYEVYMKGSGKSEGKLLFVKQYMYGLPKEELTGLVHSENAGPAPSGELQSFNPDESAGNEGRPAGELPPGNDQPGDTGKTDAGKAENGKSDAEKSDTSKKDPPAEEKKDVSEVKPDTKTETPEEKKPEEKKPEEKKPEEKKPEEKKPEEKKPEEKKPEEKKPEEKKPEEKKPEEKKPEEKKDPAGA